MLWLWNIDSEESTARINLPFLLQTNICEKFNLGFSESKAGVVHVQLRGHEEPYRALQEGHSFKKC